MANLSHVMILSSSSRFCSLVWLTKQDFEPIKD
jgi:hypothetical protein